MHSFKDCSGGFGSPCGAGGLKLFIGNLQLNPGQNWFIRSGLGGEGGSKGNFALELIDPDTALAEVKKCKYRAP